MLHCPAMPSILSRMATPFLLRRIAGDFSQLVTQMERTNTLLTRLVDVLAPATPPGDAATVREQSGLSHLDATEASLALDFADRMQRDTGRVPDDEEIATYLADEKTHDLAARLSDRERELHRHQETRTWRS